MCAHCHVVSCQVEIKDLTALEAACKRLGWEFCRGQTKYAWYGRWVDDSPVPQHLFSKEEYQTLIGMTKDARKTFMNNFLGRSDHAIRVPGCQFEIGLKKYGDAFQLVWDWAEPALAREMSSKLQHNDGGPLLQAYAIELERLRAQALGYGVVETTEADGTVQLTCSSYGG